MLCFFMTTMKLKKKKRSSSSTNSFRNSEPVDIDLVTNCPPEIMPHVCQNAGLRYKQLQGDHRTQTTFLVWVPSLQQEKEEDEEVFELSSFRYDYHPVDQFKDGGDEEGDEGITNPWKMDASYRDFTMNAISCSPPLSSHESDENDGPVLHDYFGGYNDITHKKVVWIGSPIKRMTESPVRCLRYFRFHGELNTNQQHQNSCYDELVLKEMATQKSRLRSIPPEAMWKNIKQILCSHGNVVQDELYTMSKYGFLNEILPLDGTINLDSLHWDVASTIRQRQECAKVAASLSIEPILTIAALLGWDTQKCTVLGQYWLWSNKELDLVSFLCNTLCPSSTLYSDDDDNNNNKKDELFCSTMTMEECTLRLRTEDRLQPKVTPSRDALKQVLIAQNAPYHVLQSLDTLQRPVFPVKVKDMLNHAKQEGINPLPVRNEIGEAIRWMRECWIEGGCRGGKEDLLCKWSAHVMKKKEED